MSTIINFAFKIKSEESNITFYNGATSTALDLSIPTNTYSYKTLITAVNAVISAYGSLDVTNDRQLNCNWDHASSYLTIPVTDDQENLCNCLGLYDNSGEFNRNWEDEEITQICSTSWYINRSGFLYSAYDSNGFPDFSTEHFPTEAGTTAAITGQRKMHWDPQLTYIDGDRVSGSWSYVYQDSIGVSLLADSSVSLWKAYDPINHKPLIYLETEAHGDNWYYLRQPIKTEDCKQAISNQNLYFDLDLYLTKVL